MLPVAKALVITVLLGGGAVGTCALAGEFGSGGNGNKSTETTQVSESEIAKPTVNESVTPGSSASTRESVSDASLGSEIPDKGPEDQGKEKADDVSGAGVKTIVDGQEKNEAKDVSPIQQEGSQVPESLPAAPTERAQEATELTSADGQVLPSAQTEQRDALTKTTKETEVGGENQEQITNAGGENQKGKSQDSATDGSNTDTSLKDQGVSGDEETRTASGGEDQQGTEPGTGTN